MVIGRQPKLFASIDNHEVKVSESVCLSGLLLAFFSFAFFLTELAF